MSMVFHEIIAWRWGKRKNAGLGAPAIKQVPQAVSRTKLQNDWLSDADELQ